MNDLQTTAGLPALTAGKQVDYILLDGSSSMQSKWWDMLPAIDALMAPLKDEKLDSIVTLSIFDSGDLDQVVRQSRVVDWVPLCTDPVGAHWGSTPLYDAINIMAQKLRDIPPSDRPGACYIVTDGEENASRFTDLNQAKALLDWLRAGGWQVTFIGCDFNNSAQAGLLGASPESFIGVQKKLLVDAAKNLAEKRSRFAKHGTEMHFTKDEKTQFGGYLTGGK